MNKNREEAIKALDRLKIDASCGISSDDFEIMNRSGYKKAVKQHYADVKLLTDLLTQQSPEVVSVLKLPRHEASLHLVHNQHKDYYLTVKQAIDEDDHGYTDWVSEEQKEKAILTNESWYCQWYPDTPVGFCII